jgi:hypothetical protein
VPAHRKSAEVLRLNGAFAENPNRTRPQSPTSAKPIGDPPHSLSVEERRVWRELVTAAPDNCLTSPDRVIFEIVVRLTNRMRIGNAKPADLQMLSASLTKLGWTPIDRNKVTPSGNPPIEDDGLDFLKSAAM